MEKANIVPHVFCDTKKYVDSANITKYLLTF